MDTSEQAIHLAETFGGRYRPTAYVGGGNFSGVFHAVDLNDNSEVALKVLSVLRKSPEAIVEFQTEAEMLKALAKAPNVINCLGDGVQSITLTGAHGATLPFDAQYMVLDYAVGTLEQAITTLDRLSWFDRLQLFRSAVLGVHQMHLRRIVNRDIKSSNVLLFESPPFARICDLGRSKDTRITPRFAALAYELGRGDLRFAPPELLWHLGLPRDEMYLRADLYLVGSLLFEIGTGLGITAYVFGDVSSVISHARALPSDAAREADFVANLNNMRGAYEQAYDVFAQEVAPPIRQPAVELLRRLTDPEPEARDPSARLLRNLPGRWDLQWVLRRIDLLCKILKVHERPALRRKVRR